MRTLVAANRLLWALLVVVGIAYLAGRGWLARPSAAVDPVAPVPVPEATIGTLPAPVVPVTPDGELFAVAEQPAGPAVVAPAPSGGAGVDAGMLRGIVRLPGFAGAFTTGGFVAEGAELDGITVEAVGPDGVEVRTAQGTGARLPLAGDPRPALPQGAELRIERLR